MSVQSEITRLANAKTALATAIEGKGVTVPEGTKLDGMAALVDAIEAGGGLALEYNRLKVAASGTFTVAERTEISNSNPYVIQHGAGIIPLLILIEAGKVSQNAELMYMLCWRVPHYNASYYNLSQLTALVAKKYSSYYNVNFGKESVAENGMSWTDIQANVLVYNSTCYLNAGITYSWRAYTIE